MIALQLKQLRNHFISDQLIVLFLLLLHSILAKPVVVKVMILYDHVHFFRVPMVFWWGEKLLVWESSFMHIMRIENNEFGLFRLTF